MPPENAVLETPEAPEAHLTLVEPSSELWIPAVGGRVIGPGTAAARSFIRSALAERPWAIKRSWLSMMLRSDVLPLEAPTVRPELAAMSHLERMGGAMIGPVAVIPIYGVITQRSSFWSWLFGGTSVDDLRNCVREALADQATSALVFDIDSPGGSVDGITELAAELRALRGGPKPMLAVANPLAASAAEWIGCSLDEFVVTPSGEVGSIGVYAAHEDVSGAYEMAGIKVTLISAGKYKTEGNPFEPLTDEGETAIQEQVDTFYQMFLRDVSAGRGVSIDVVANGYGEGRTMLAKKALAAGMVDRIATLEETIRRLQPRGARKAMTAEMPSIDPLADASGAVETGETPDAVESGESPEAGETPADPIPTESAAIAAAPSRPDRAWNARIAKRKPRRTR